MSGRCETCGTGDLQAEVALDHDDNLAVAELVLALDVGNVALDERKLFLWLCVLAVRFWVCVFPETTIHEVR